MTRQERLIRAMAPIGGLFLLVTLQEIRRQGLSYLALYMLERTVQGSGPWHEEGLLVSGFRSETGLKDYEISKACALLKKGDLVTIEKAAGSRRERILVPTARGIRILDKVLSAAANRLWEGLPPWARGRRVSETTRILGQGGDKLLGSIQLTFLDKHAPTKPAKRPRKSSTRPEDRTGKPVLRKRKRTPKRESRLEQTCS
jgi:hypothetical protein